MGFIVTTMLTMALRVVSDCQRTVYECRRHGCCCSGSLACGMPVRSQSKRQSASTPVSPCNAARHRTARAVPLSYSPNTGRLAPFRFHTAPTPDGSRHSAFICPDTGRLAPFRFHAAPIPDGSRRSKAIFIAFFFRVCLCRSLDTTGLSVPGSTQNFRRKALSPSVAKFSRCRICEAPDRWSRALSCLSRSQLRAR
jgi:hypothetical protein